MNRQRPVIIRVSAPVALAVVCLIVFCIGFAAGLAWITVP